MERHPDLANAADSLLLVIDPQEKLVRMIHNREEVVGNIVRLLKFASIFSLPVILTEHYPQGLGYTVEEVNRELSEYRPILKRVFSCFGVPEFEEAVKGSGRKRLLVCGIETHICVCQTVLDALHRGYLVQVVSDAVGTRRPEDHYAALSRMRDAGATVTTSEALIYEVTCRADGEEFKKVLDLVK
ncbi:hydrolase [Candidatus Solincola tengchongensis]|uniref:hydrolase n=1 Tax=Candidatus Solincola tengchongensis TaxID=2900693 RepID=UPI00257C787D|nr:hydrolase [Candidatus Solincola tengchongensis]